VDSFGLSLTRKASVCPSPPSTLSFAPGLRLSISDPNAQDFLRELRALTDRFVSKGSSSIVEPVSSEANCLLPLNLSQSQLLAALVTTFVPRSTWWSKIEGSESWVLFGRNGEDSGPQVTVFISATSDRDVSVMA